ncbi:hypothetical protein H310_14707 [Aphanomyces invadans]|uniref:Anaphase-promoting complex subunit 4 WD40 domain-containing protein n=1 Tax=Aphanomyces invadans TaxID=157072 RepID=A0A024TB12_9STRA|nr:hypothetical protein H310_14707 [Aphanomyces invadans]ETV90517.1 hypothetical protein H310_14707 [Aphanomyces invadans]|eukprot:XP_008880833.1 hypothetical protein H310_14707 [Aphanomyces invadans]
MGHCSRKLGGLAAHPTNHEMCSVGDDQSIRVWDLIHHRNLRMVNLDAPARSCMYSPDGVSLVVGAQDNSIYIYDVPNEYAKRATFTKHKRVWDLYRHRCVLKMALDTASRAVAIGTRRMVRS